MFEHLLKAGRSSAAGQVAGINLEMNALRFICLGFFQFELSCYNDFMDLVNVNFRKIIVFESRDGIEFLCLILSVLCGKMI